MKVLRISSYFGVPRRDLHSHEMMRKSRAFGGMQLQVRLLTETLSDLGTQQDVITTRPPWSSPFEEWDNVHVYRFGMPTALRHQFYQLPALLRVIRLDTTAFDLVHVHTGEDIAAIPIGLVAACRAHVPFVLTIHSSWNLTYRRMKRLQMLRHMVGRRIEIVGLRWATAVCTLTHMSSNLFARHLGIASEKLFVVPDSIDLSLFRSEVKTWEIADFAELYHIPPSERYVLFLGRLSAQKGVRYLLEAAVLLKNRKEDFHLLICGDGIERTYLENRTMELGLIDHVTFTGFIHHQDTPKVLSIADVIVVPSVYEEFGSVLLEAMAMRRPIVATRVGGIPETIRHMENGLLVTPCNAANLANATTLLFHNRELAHKLAHQAYFRPPDLTDPSSGVR